MWYIRLLDCTAAVAYFQAANETARPWQGVEESLNCAAYFQAATQKVSTSQKMAKSNEKGFSNKTK